MSDDSCLSISLSNNIVVAVHLWNLCNHIDIPSIPDNHYRGSGSTQCNLHKLRVGRLRLITMLKIS